MVPPTFPRWINAEFQTRLGLKQRWEEIQNENPSPHPVRKMLTLASPAIFHSAWPGTRTAEAVREILRPTTCTLFWTSVFYVFSLRFPPCRGAGRNTWFVPH